ncbi:MAG: mechanosensitive ion channel family protein [Paracoccaceae bacterium]
MELISIVDAFIGRNLWIAVVGAALTTVWVWWRIKWYRSQVGVSVGTYQLINAINGVLWLIALLSALNLISAAVGLEQDMYSTRSLRFWAYLAVHLIVAFVVARALELVWISKSNFVTEGYIPGLPRALLFGSVLLLGLVVFGVKNGLWVGGLYISTGALAAVIAFAMQQTLGDFFAGVSLSVEHPFKIGDWLELEDGTQGEVRDLNWRATRLRAWDNSTLIVPNGVLARQRFRNLHSANHRYSPWYEVTLPAEVDPRMANALLLDVALNCKKVMQTPLPTVRLSDSGKIPYTYLVWLHYKDYPSMFAGREEFFRNMHYALRDAGIQSAPQMQDLRVQRAEKTEVRPLSIRHMLQSLDFASVFDEDELETMVNRSYLETVDAGTIIQSEGETSPSVDIIWNGLIETSVVDDAGKSRTLEPLAGGAYFGLASMLMDIPNFQTFTAMTDVTLLRIDQKCFKELVSAREDVLLTLAEIVNQRMAKAESIKKQQDRSSGPDTLRYVFRRLEQFVGGRKPG